MHLKMCTLVSCLVPGKLPQTKRHGGIGSCSYSRSEGLASPLTSDETLLVRGHLSRWDTLGVSLAVACTFFTFW